MKTPEVGTTLGKCIFDNGVIVEGQSIRSQYATLLSLIHISEPTRPY